jgi:hypothetical protein
MQNWNEDTNKQMMQLLNAWMLWSWLEGRRERKNRGR